MTPPSVRGAYVWAPLILQEQGTITCSTGSEAMHPGPNHNGGQLINNGTLTVNGPVQFALGDGSDLINTSNLTLSGSGVYHIGGAPSTLHNSGTLTITGGDTIFGGGVLDLFNLGTIVVNSKLVLNAIFISPEDP